MSFLAISPSRLETICIVSVNLSVAICQNCCEISLSSFYSAFYNKRMDGLNISDLFQGGLSSISKSAKLPGASEPYHRCFEIKIAGLIVAVLKTCAFVSPHSAMKLKIESSIIETGK